MKPLKQVIVMRNDLNMRKGKMIAQGAHASVLSALTIIAEENNEAICLRSSLSLLDEWLNQGMMKIAVRADSEEQLLDIERKAREGGLNVQLIVDAGHTEFAGVPTKTCLCIGPNYSEDIDKITGELKLL